MTAAARAVPTAILRTNAIRRRDLLSLALILFVAAVMRLGEPGVIEFKHDEARLALMAQELVAGKVFPFTGIPSSVGLPNPPVSVYFVAIPYLLKNDPLFASLFIAAWNVAGVGLLWLLAHRYLNRTAALAAGLAYALNPWAVLYSRKIWAQDFHTPFVLIGLLLGLYGFLEGKRWAQVLCLPVLVLAFQIHFAAWALLPVYVWLLWTGRRRLSWQAFALSILLTAFTLAPYAVGMKQTLDDDPGRLDYFLGRSSANGFSLTGDSWKTTAQLATGLGIETQVAPFRSADLLEQVPPQPQLWLLLGALTLLGAAVVWTRTYRPLAVIIVLWALLPALSLTPHWVDAYPHYFIASLPALSLLAGIGVAWLVRWLPGQPISRTVVLTGFCAILLTQAIWWRGMLRWVDTHGVIGFDISLRHLLDLASFLKPYDDVLVLTQDARIEYRMEPVIWKSILDDPARCVRALDSRNMALLPGGEFALLVYPNFAYSPADAIYHVGQPSGVYPMLPTGEIFQIQTFDSPLSVDAPLFLPMPPASFANDVLLSGYAARENEVWLQWRLPDAHYENYQYFIHLLDANGEKISQHDEDFYPGRYWCEGDRLLTWAAFDTLADAVTLRVGLYILRGTRFTNIPIVDANGIELAPWADLPLPLQEAQA